MPHETGAAHTFPVEWPIRPAKALHGAADAVATGYAFLPFAMVAGLSVFPLTAVEGLAYAVPVLAVEIGVAALHLDGLDWGTHLGSLWLLFLIAVVATLSGMSQLGLMMALVRLAVRDCLTCCFTRNTGEELLEIQFKIAQRNQSPLALVFADLDNFKAINDIHGHKAGDRALVHASNTMSSTLRTSDILVRWAGEEFVLILPSTDRNDAIGVIDFETTAAGPVEQELGRTLSFILVASLTSKPPPPVQSSRNLAAP